MSPRTAAVDARRWATVDGVLLALVRGYSRARVHGGASWLVELHCAGLNYSGSARLRLLDTAMDT